MIARFVILIFVAVLALPIASLTRPEDTSPTLWGDVAVEAKGKKHKHKKPKFKTVRQEVTRTFHSIDPITIAASGQAHPYPSAIAVSGFTNGAITDVDLLLENFTHGSPRDVDLLLSMSDVGRPSPVTDIHFTLDDEAAAPLPAETGELSSGTFRPTDINPYVPEPDTFAAPAPAPNGAVALSIFDGTDPNGTWQLWAKDDDLVSFGSLRGWALQITAEVDVQVKVKHKKGKKGNGRH